MNPAVFEDCFNLLCGEKIGSGQYRDVFKCKIRPDLVVKVEHQAFRGFANILEQRFWDDNQYYNDVSKWLAPCEYLSPDGRILLQAKCDPIRLDDKLPEKVPAFLTDIKRENFGLLEGKIVCVDYAITIPNPSVRMVKADFK